MIKSIVKFIPLTVKFLFRITGVDLLIAEENSESVKLCPQSEYLHSLNEESIHVFTLRLDLLRKTLFYCFT